MTVSIVVPTIRANPKMLDECISSVKDTAPDAQLVISDDDASFAENANRGALMADGDLLVFLNDDCVCVPGWLDPLIAPLGPDSDIGITGARCLYPDNTIQHAGVYLDAPDGVLTAHNVQTDEPTRDVDAVTGACLAITRTLFAECTGFDPGFVNGYDDVDLCLRVRAGGWRVRYIRDSVVYHHESQSGPRRWEHVSHNIQRLQDLWNVTEAPVDG